MLPYPKEKSSSEDSFEEFSELKSFSELSVSLKFTPKKSLPEYALK